MKAVWRKGTVDLISRNALALVFAQVNGANAALLNVWSFHNECLLGFVSDGLIETT